MQAELNAPPGATAKPCSKSERIAEAIEWANNFARHNVTVSEALGSRRYKQFVRVRHLATWRLRVVHRWTFPKIARAFGGRDHASIMHGVKKINAEFELPENYPLDVWTADRAKILSDLAPAVELIRTGTTIDDASFALGVPMFCLRKALRAAGHDIRALAQEGVAFRQRRMREEAERSDFSRAMSRSFGI